MKTRLRIDRLVLRTQGLTPAAAESAARAIPHALAAHLAPHAQPGAAVSSLTITVAPGDSPAQLARAIATRLAHPPSA